MPTDTSAGDGLEERLYVTPDANFNVTALTDSSDNAAERYLYDLYGTATVLAANWQPTTGNYAWQYLHQGGRYDPATTLHHFRNRDYSAELGRWVQQDPLGYVDGASLYAFVSANPANRLDPMGLWGLGHRDRLAIARQERDQLVRQKAKIIQDRVDQYRGRTGNYQLLSEWDKQRLAELDVRIRKLEAQIAAHEAAISKVATGTLDPGAGHSDFPGSDEFDYNLDDNDPKTNPVTGDPERHFRALSVTERDIAAAISSCDKEAFERAMHRGQDYFSHYANGYRFDPPWDLGHATAPQSNYPDDPTSARNTAKQHWERLNGGKIKWVGLKGTYLFSAILDK